MVSLGAWDVDNIPAIVLHGSPYEVWSSRLAEGCR